MGSVGEVVNGIGMLQGSGRRWSSSSSLGCRRTSAICRGTCSSHQTASSVSISTKADAAFSTSPSLSTSDCYLLLPPSHVVKQQQQPTLASDDYDSYYSLSEKRVLRVNNRNNNRLQEDLGSRVYGGNIRLVGSSGGWLAYVNTETLDAYLLNPFSPNPPIVLLPPVASFPGILMSVRSRNSWFSKSHLHPLNSKYRNAFYGTGLQPVSAAELMSDWGHPIFAVNDDDDCPTVMISMEGSLAFCRFGDASWRHAPAQLEFFGGANITSNERHDYCSLVYSNADRRFYACSYDGLEAWDLTDISSPKRTFFYRYSNANLPFDYSLDYEDHLVVDPSSGELWMVDRSIIKNDDEEDDVDDDESTTETLGFAIIKVDLNFSANMDKLKKNKKRKKKKREKVQLVESLGDHALFLDKNQCAMVSVRDFPTFKPNSIYFIDKGSFDKGDFDIGVFSLEERTTVDHYPGKKIGKEATWVIPS